MQDFTLFPATIYSSFIFTLRWQIFIFVFKILTLEFFLFASAVVEIYATANIVAAAPLIFVGGLLGFVLNNRILGLGFKVLF